MRNFFNFLKSRTFLIQLGLALVALVVLVFLLLGWLKSTTNHGEFVEVPDFSKMSVMDMRKAVEDSDLRYEVLDSANYNPDYPRFSIGLSFVFDTAKFAVFQRFGPSFAAKVKRV